jgi:hypothetical protein
MNVLALLVGLLASNSNLASQSANGAQSLSDVGAPVTSSDCTAARPPQNFSRIFIAAQTEKQNGSGTASDPYDGGTAEKFDTLLRARSEANQQNIIVCIGPGTFQTEGNYDFVINVAHKTARGFTINKNWKIHGAGTDKTVLQLVNFFPNALNMPKGTGAGLVLSTHDDSASGIEISDLTVDANYPTLKPLAARQGTSALNLEAIHLRDDQGGHWIHNVNVIHAAGEVNEVFPVWIVSVNNKSSTQNTGNIIEGVTVSDWGGGKCTAIAMANALGEIRNNVVTGYQIGYGGWSMGKVVFHDNVAINTDYGFNIDSLENDGVSIHNNRIVHPRHYGMVIGGGGRYANFEIVDNIFEINTNSVIGIVLQGNVTNALIAKNKFIAERPATQSLRMTITKHGGNQGNVYRSNEVVSGPASGASQ